jgi:hypothetical protein
VVGVIAILDDIFPQYCDLAKNDVATKIAARK